MEAVQLKLCLSCQKPIRGRSDKKFCDDYCRNSHNNKLVTEDNAVIKQINRFLKNNRKILAGLLPEGNHITCALTTLQQQGFQFKYFTHQYNNKKGNIYHFCYDYGYLLLEDKRVLIVKEKTAPAKTD